MVAVTTLGGTAQGVEVAKVAHGLLMMSEFSSPRLIFTRG